MEETLKDIVSKFLGITKQKLSELIQTEEGEANPEGLKELTKMYKAKLSEQNTKGYDRGKAESLADSEEALKEKYGVETDKKGVDLIDFIVSEQTKNSSIDPSKALTEDAIRKHPVYIQKEKEVKAAKDEFEKKFNEAQQGWQKEKTFDSVKLKALSKLDALGPNLSPDPARASYQKELFLNQLKGYEFEDQNGHYLPLRAGKRIEKDDLGNHISSLDELVELEASKMFDLPKAAERSSAGKKEDITKPGGNTNALRVPKTRAELDKILNDPTLSARERRDIRNEYQAKVAG